MINHDSIYNTQTYSNKRFKQKFNQRFYNYQISEAIKTVYLQKVIV